MVTIFVFMDSGGMIFDVDQLDPNVGTSRGPIYTILF